MSNNHSGLLRALTVGVLCFLFLSLSPALSGSSENQPSGLHDPTSRQRIGHFNGNSDVRNLETDLAKDVSTATLNLAKGGSIGSFATAGWSSVPLFAPSLTATKTDALATDVNGNGKADPGDTLMYTVTITNTGDEDATNVMFSDTIDSNTTLVGGSVTVGPIAMADTYQTIGNVNIQVPAMQGLLSNDLNPGGSGTLAITAFDATSTGGGAVTVNTSDGSFTYNPAAGFRGPTDSFSYTVGNGTGKTDAATVTINIAGMIWFIDDSSTDPTGGDGRLTSPFKGLVGTDTATVKNFSNSTLDQANDSIFLFSGSYTGGLTLLDGQRFIGEGAPDSILTITGLGAPSGSNQLPATNGTDPTITTAGATAITLGQNNQLHGFTIGNTTATGTDVSGNSFGSLTAKDVSLTGTGQALNLMTGTFAAGSTFATLESSGGSPGQGIRLNAVGGSFTATTTNIVNPTGTGIEVQSAPGGTNFNFGSTTVNKGSTAGTGVNLNSNSGTFAFSSLGVTTSNGTGVAATNSGTVNVSGGSISATGGPALLVNPTTLGMTFASVSSTNSPTTGISLTSAGGSLTIGTTTITNPSGIGISVASSSLTVNFGNTTANDSGGAGVVLGGSGTGNTGAITFGTLNIDPDTNQKGLVAIDNTMTITTSSGTIITNASSSATNAAAVEITRSSSTTPLAITLTSVSIAAGTNGIFLRNTSGSFTINGDGTNTAVGGNSTGGTISNMSGADGTTAGSGVYLENVQNVTLRRMTINGTNQNHGIRGIGVTGFTLGFSTVSGTNGTSAAEDEGSVNFDNLLGSAAITSSVIEGGLEDNLNVVNTVGTLNRLTITGSTFGFNNTTQGNNNILLESRNVGTVLNWTIQSSTIKGARADWISAINNSGSTMDAIVGGSTVALGNTFDNLGANAHPGAAAGGNRLVLGAVGPQTVDIRNNTLVGGKGGAIFVRGTGTATGLTGSVNARVRNNTIGVQGIADSGSSEGSGIFIFGDGGSDMNVAVTDNTVFQYNNHGISLTFGDEINDGSVFNVTVTGNTISNPGTINTDFNGFHLNNGTVAATDNFTTCLHLSGNTLTGSGKGTTSPNNQEFRLRQRQSTTVRLPGYAGANNNDAQVVSFIQGQNTVSAGQGAASNTVPTGGGFVGGAACTAPSVTLSTLAEEVTTASVIESDGSLVPDSETDDSLRAARGEAPFDDNVRKLSQEELIWIVQAALARWSETGISLADMSRLEAVTFEIADLPANQIATSDSTHIKIDETAAGRGWYLDPTPWEDGEFQVLVPNKELQTTDISPAHGKMDLLTVVMHQLGQVYREGKERIPGKLRRNLRPLMEPTLSPSVRRMPLDQWNVTPPQTSKAGSGAGGLSNAAEKISRDGDTMYDNERATTAGLPSGNSSAASLPVTRTVFNSKLHKRVASYARNIQPASNGLMARRVALFKPSGETVSVGPFTLPPGESVTIMFSVTINTPVTPAGTTQVCNQGAVTADGGLGVMTDDPDVGGAADPTCTTLAQADLEITAKEDSPATEVPAGDNITYTINFRNNGPDTAHNVKVSDPIPANTTFVSVGPLPAGWTRTDGVAAGGTGTIMFEKGMVANAETASFTLVVQVDAATPASTTISNTASTTSDTPDGTAANNSKTATTNVTSQADLSITKTNGTTTEIPGTTTTYTIVVSNNGPNLVTGATVSDTFPAALTGVTFTSVASGGATGNTASGTGNINDTVNMPNGSTITYTVTGTIDPAATGTLTNTATVTVPVGVTDPVPGNNTATDTDTLTADGDLSITKTNGTTTEVPGTTTTYTIVVTNNGPSNAVGAIVADTFPGILTGVTFTSVAAGGATGNTAAGSGNINDTVSLPTGSSITYTATGTIDPGATGTLTNTATVSAPDGFTDSDGGNNSATDTDTLTLEGDLSITKTNGTTSKVPGTTTTYTIVVTNSGPSDVIGATVSDTFPAELSGVTFTSVAAGGATGNTAAGSGNINDTVDMPAGSTITYTATGTIDPGALGSLTNTATVSAPNGITDPNPGNNSATDTDTLIGEGDLSISKTNGTVSSVPGTTTTYTIVVSYTGVSNVVGGVVSDMFPAALTGVSFTSVATGTVTGNTGMGTGNINDTVSMTSGSTITYTVMGAIDPSATGVLTNTATVSPPMAFTDSNPGNNSATDTDTLTPQADLSVTKTDSPDPVASGANLTYTINLVNNGPSNAVSVQLSDPTPANTTFQSAMVVTGSGWGIASPAVGGTGAVSFTKGAMAPGESATFRIIVRVALNLPPNTTISNTASSMSVTADPNGANSFAIATTLVLRFDKCVRDDKTGRIVRWNSLGEYEYVDLSKNIRFSGTGVASTLPGGCKLELKAQPSKTGNKHFVSALANVCTKAGSFEFRENGTGTPIVGTDADITNNNCTFP